MAKYREFKGLNLQEIDKEILRFWEENDIFKKSVEQRPEDNQFIFYEGPPSANGKPGIHHVFGRAIKDLVCRYQTMQGKRVERKGGWDTHGLPVELKVEKENNITKEDIGKKISIEEYNNKCRTTVMQFVDMWNDITRKMGYWVDLDDPYITFKNEYIESVWYLLGQLYKKGLIYKGYTIQPYSPGAGTGLSSHELNLPGCYKDVKDTTVVAQFKVPKNEKTAFLYDGVEKGDVYFIAWTTTPWTLPSNTALAVGADIDYVRVATYNPYTKEPVNLILAKDLLHKWFSPEQAEADYDSYDPEKDKVIPYKITGEYKGKDFEMLEYEQLMPYKQPEDGPAFKVLLGDFVSTDEGTGIVHIAPSFGADDMQVAKKYGIGSLTLVDKQGKFVEGTGDLEGRYVKNYKDDPQWEDTDLYIAMKLKKANKAFSIKKYEHSYPHCWRTDKPILYYPLDSWFIKTTAMQDRLIELNKTINWKPPHTGSGRFGKWLENLQDWNLSRSRFWGIPLPIWRTEDGEEELFIESVEQLSGEIEKAIAAGFMTENPYASKNYDDFDLHRPYIDDVILVSPSGKKMYREKDLIDVWFDSGSMPAAQFHYPFENQEKFKTHFPADFISEGVDQTRGWFFTLHAIATMVFDSVAFKNVISTGLVLDRNGEKMSKRKGNVIDPFATIDKYGADPTRWYMISTSPPWENLKFDSKGIEETTRKFFITLYNTYSFFALYANLDGFDYSQEPVPLQERAEIDRWIISLLNTLKKEVKAHLDDFDLTPALRKIQTFVYDHLSNWYVRLNRRRFWKSQMSQDKLAAYQTLFEVLFDVAKLMAPAAPFFGEWLYRNLNEVAGKEDFESVHLSYYPRIDEGAIDKDLEQRMDYAQRISSLVLSLRKKQRLRVRQPLQKILLPILDNTFSEQVEKVKDLILHEVNVKEIEYITDTSGIIKKKIKPNFKTLGRLLGKNMKDAAAIINAMSQEEIDAIEKTGGFELEVNGEKYNLTAGDVIISAEDIPGWLVANDGDLTVALDITLTPELIAEGLARELVNRIQNMRKANDFDVTDRIIIEVSAGDELKDAIEKYGDYIKSETLADEIIVNPDLDAGEIELNENVKTRLKVTKSKS